MLVRLVIRHHWIPPISEYHPLVDHLAILQLFLSVLLCLVIKGHHHRINIVHSNLASLLDAFLGNPLKDLLKQFV